MRDKTMGAAEFKAKCLRVIDEMNRDHEPVTITKHGRPVAVLSPVGDVKAAKSVFGAMKGTVRHYDGPFDPAMDPSDWNAVS